MKANSWRDQPQLSKDQLELGRLLERLKMPPAPGPGLLVAVCGVDGAGKSSLAHLLVVMLETMGLSCRIVRMPSQHMRHYPLFRQLYCETRLKRAAVDPLAICMMVMADRLQQLRHDILPPVHSGSVVICDRYIYTGLVEAFVREAEPMDPLIILSNLFPVPHLSILASSPPEITQARVRARSTEVNTSVDEELVRRLSHTYDELGKLLDFTILDTSLPLAETRLSLQELANELVVKATCPSSNRFLPLLDSD